MPDYQNHEIIETAPLWERWLPVSVGLFIIWFTWPLSGSLFFLLTKSKHVDDLSAIFPFWLMLLISIPITLVIWSSLILALPVAIWNRHRFRLSPSGRLEVQWRLGFRSGSFEVQADELQLIRCQVRTLQFYSIAKGCQLVPFSSNPAYLHRRLCSVLKVPDQGVGTATIPKEFGLTSSPCGEGLCLGPTQAQKWGCLFTLILASLGYLGFVTLMTAFFVNMFSQGWPERSTLVGVAAVSLVPWFFVLRQLQLGKAWVIKRGYLLIPGLQEFHSGPVTIVEEQESEGGRTWAIQIDSAEIWRGSKDEAEDFAEWLRYETGWM